MAYVYRVKCRYTDENLGFIAVIVLVHDRAVAYRRNSGCDCVGNARKIKSLGHPAECL
jgi:hypothetical protein